MLPVTVVCGFDRRPATTVARELLGSDSDAALLTHCLDRVADGFVGPGLLELVHGCVSCTLREGG